MVDSVVEVEVSDGSVESSSAGGVVVVVVRGSVKLGLTGV